MKLALLDTDIIIYRASVLSENEPEHLAIDRYKYIRNSWLDASRCDAFASFVSKGQSFRRSWYSGYKADRDDKQRPRHLSAVKTYALHNDYGLSVDGLEADDLIGIHADEPNSIIVTVDKDLDQIEGWHCNPDKERIYYVDEDRASMTWMSQILSGDPTDCYPGVPGIGERKAYQMLDEACISDRFAVVKACYESKGQTEEHLKSMIVCATIMKGIKWHTPWSPDTVDRFIHDTFRSLGLQQSG